ncbi:MAG: cupin domain-containing protein [Nitriliruptorales bacterium]|nr:cupin domain-containing protein [Nitriliruptorales bacterium]
MSPPADGSAPLFVRRAAELVFQELPGRRSADPLAPDPPVAMSVRVVELSPGRDRTPHRHPHSEEAVYVLAGRGRVWAAGGTTSVSAGDLVVVPRATPHATLPDLGVTMRLLCVFPHPDLRENLEELGGPALG